MSLAVAELMRSYLLSLIDGPIQRTHFTEFSKGDSGISTYSQGEMGLKGS